MLAIAAAVAGSLAGCSGTDAPAGSPAGRSDGESTPTGGATGPTVDAQTADRTTAGGTPTATPLADGGLDLREANVTGVAVERADGGYRFDVTLHHDDDGEEGYANWWQVETRAGERLGRRDLLHAHGTREFTRSATIEVPDGVPCVVVRGHDETHGYGGRAMLVTLDTVATAAVDQGAEPASLGRADCP